jgi:hypothetical protein
MSWLNSMLILCGFRSPTLMSQLNVGVAVIANSCRCSNDSRVGDQMDRSIVLRKSRETEETVARIPRRTA